MLPMKIKYRGMIAGRNFVQLQGYPAVRPFRKTYDLEIAECRKK
jgi:hypothetical protein